MLWHSSPGFLYIFIQGLHQVMVFQQELIMIHHLVVVIPHDLIMVLERLVIGLVQNVFRVRAARLLAVLS